MSEQYATQLVEPLDDSLVGYVKKLLASRIREKKAKPTTKYHGADVYFLGDKQNGYSILARDNEILYFVRYEAVKHNKLELGRQVLVWSNKTDPASAGFAAHIFFDYLLPKYKALIADKQQTSHGQRFWTYAINRALESNLRVYFLNRRTSPNELIELRSIEDAVQHRNDLWGTEAGHLRTFAVISQIPLQIKT